MAAAWLMTPLADAQSRPASQPTSAPAKQDPKDMDSTKGTGSTKGNEPVALPTSDRDWFKIVPPDSETTRRAIAKALPIFEKGNASDVQNEITDLCELKDAAVIPYLLPLLNRGSDEESEQIRSAVIRGMLRTFKTEAPSVLQQLVEKGQPAQVEAALYGLGYVYHPATPDLVLRFIQHPEEKVRRAVAYALSQSSNLLLNAVNNHCVRDENRVCDHPDGEHVPSELYARQDQTREKLMAAVLAHDLSLSEEIFYAFRTLGDYGTTVRLMDHFVANVDEEKKELAAFLKKAQAVNRRWAGRPERFDVRQVDYDVYMMNVMSNKEKTFGLHFDGRMAEAMRARRIHLDRGMRMALALDELLQYPQICDPRVEEHEDGFAVRYKIPMRGQVEMGIGCMNIYFWAARTVDANEVVTVFDPETHTPIKDTIYGEDDAEIAVFEYTDYAEVAEGALVPRIMHVDMKRVPHGQKVRRMQYECEFQTKDGLWFLSEATCFQVDGESTEIRAIGEIQNVRVRKHGPLKLGS